MRGLLEKISSLYGIGPITSTDPVTKGFLSENHVISAGTTRYFLKKYRFADSAKIFRIHASKSFFAQGGIPVIMPLLMKDGSSFFTHESAHYTLFPYVSGRHLDGNRMTPRAAVSLGRMLGRIHLRGAKCTLDTEVASKPEDRAADLEQLKLLLVKAHQMPTRDNFDRTAIEILEIKKSFAESAPRAPHPSPANDHLLHGDYHDANVFFDERDEVAHVFDLEKTGYGPRTDEIFRAMNYSLICGGEKADIFTNIRAYIDGYQDIYPIPTDELAAGLRRFYDGFMHGHWIESEHYLHGNTRVDVLARFELARLKFLTAHLGEMTARLTRC